MRHLYAGANVPAVATSEIPNKRGTKTIPYVFIGQYRNRFNLLNIEYYQSVTERNPILVLKCSYLKDLDDVDPFSIRGVLGRKQSEQGRLGLDFTAVITYKTRLVVNGKPVTVSLDLVEKVACNTIFS